MLLLYLTIASCTTTCLRLTYAVCELTMLASNLAALQPCKSSPAMLEKDNLFSL